MKTDKRYVSNFKNGAWDEGVMTEDDMVVISECACVLQYAQTIFEGLKAYTTVDGRVVCFGGFECRAYDGFCKKA